jgi:hypothetical protein
MTASHFPKSRFQIREVRRAAAAVAVCLLGAGCASISDNISDAFVDPAKYDLYNCTQLRAVRTANAARIKELRGLMDKAETGAAGSVVSQVAYGNDYVAAKAQSRLADEVWARNKCDSEPLPPEKVDPAAVKKDLSTDAKRKH